MNTNTYKITNITDKLGKRDVNFNSTLSIKYIDEMEKKTISLKPKHTIYYTTSSLPLSLHKYRVKGLVSIEEVSDKELEKIKGVNNTESKENTTTTTTTSKKRKTSDSKKNKTYNKKSETSNSKKSTSSSSKSTSYSKTDTSTSTKDEE